VIADDITIVAGGKRLEGILRFELRAPVEGMPRSFHWTITERFTDQLSKIVVTPRTSCQVYLGADQVMQGWIDRYQPYFDKLKRFASRSIARSGAPTEEERLQIVKMPAPAMAHVAQVRRLVYLTSASSLALR
jgi:hypothetical protein